jgi:hypothetical protein
MTQKKEFLLNNIDSIEVLIVGNSHAMHGVVPENLSLPACNIAYASQAIYFDKRIVEKYLPQMKKLKYVVINFDYFTLYVEHVENRDFFYKYYYDIDYKDRKFYKEFISQFLFVYSPQPTFEMLFTDLSGRGKELVEKKWAGTVENLEEIITSVEDNKKRAMQFNELLTDTTARINVFADLEDFVKMLKSKNITTIFINYPVNPALRVYYKDDVLQDNKSVADYFVEKYGVIYLDYEADDSFLISDYYDPDHLNYPGAIKLTARLDSLIMQIENNKMKN